MNETGRRAGGRAPPRPDERHGAGDEAMRAKGFDDDVRLARAPGKTHGGGSAADAAADAGATRYPGCPTPPSGGGMPEAAARRRPGLGDGGDAGGGVVNHSLTTRAHGSRAAAAPCRTAGRRER